MSNLNNFSYNARVGKETANPNRLSQQHPRLLRVNLQRFKAYNVLFADTKSFQDACEIVWKEWFAKNPNDPIPTVRSKQKF